MKKIIFGLIATVFLAFNAKAQTLRADFLKGKTYDQVIESFNKLNSNDKAALWIEKMDQLLKENLPSQHKEAITKLKSSLVKNGYNSKAPGFVDAAVNLAEMTPLEDFVKMIESLDDYKYNGKFIDTNKVPNSIVEDIGTINSPPPATNEAKVTCSCRWCIGIDHVYSNCKPTDSGCGFLFMQPCTHSITGL